MTTVWSYRNQWTIRVNTFDSPFTFRSEWFARQSSCLCSNNHNIVRHPDGYWHNCVCSKWYWWNGFIWTIAAVPYAPCVCVLFTIDWMMMLVLVLSLSPGGSTHCYNHRWFIRAYLCSVFRITPWSLLWSLSLYSLESFIIDSLEVSQTLPLTESKILCDVGFSSRPDGTWESGTC